MRETGHWASYAPDDKAPWDLSRVAHLHRRAAFAATWDELQRDLKDGPDKSVTRLLEGAVNGAANAAPGDFEATSELLADTAVASGATGRLRAWWFYRMLFTPDPLGERLTLLWHDHFATGAEKVRDVGLMRGQNETLRKHARGKFGELLNAAVRDPALLHYLDAPANRKGHPNENLARELMELFTLGEGNYTEADVKEAARCLTGWTVEGRRFAEANALHDTGEKTVLGKSGRWSGSDLVALLLKHPAIADRVAAKLGRQFFGEKVLPPDAAKELAAGMRERDLDVGWAVGTVLRSRLFFAAANIRSRVLAPAEYVAGTARALGLTDLPPSALALADWSARMGQDLLDPPNVGGWPGGRAWIDPRSMIARANYVTALLTGPPAARAVAYDAAAQPQRYGFGAGREAVLAFHHRLLFGTDPTDEMKRRAAGLAGVKTVALLLSSPEGQLG